MMIFYDEPVDFPCHVRVMCHSVWVIYPLMEYGHAEKTRKGCQQRAELPKKGG